MAGGRYRGAVWRHALAVCCIAAPIVFALGLPQAPILMTKYDYSRPDAKIPHYAFLPDERDAAPAAPVGDGQNPGTSNAKKSGNGAEQIRKEDLNALLTARDISGRLRYAAISALLCLVSVGALIYGAVILTRRRGALALLFALPLVVVASLLLSGNAPTFERIRPVIAELILRDAEAKNFLPTSPVWDAGYLASLLVHINTFAALVAVGMLLAALYAISMRASDEELTFRDLTNRREIARWLLGFSSAILVIAVVASQILVEWPSSLLVRSQQLALKPIGAAMTLLLGATGTIALFGAFAPAIAAFTLDVRRYRIGTVARTAAAGNELGFAPASSITAVFAALAPLLASSLVEVLKGLL